VALVNISLIISNFATMGRILAIDYGRKRCGLAVTDILKIAANGLETVRTVDLPKFLTSYCATENVEEIVVGYPRTMSGEESESMTYIRPFLKSLSTLLPNMKVTLFDERFTSTLAHRAMIEGGLKKKNRQEKGLADKMAATIILTDYLQSISL
jgi:putative Holliday junction resolvase